MEKVSGRSVVLGLALLLCAPSAFAQSGAASIDYANQTIDDTIGLPGKQILAAPVVDPVGYFADTDATTTPTPTPTPTPSLGESAATLGNPPVRLRPSKPADFNRQIYYRNKLEFSLDVGWLPINVPFPLDIFVGDVYNTYPLKYTLVPIIGSLRWQMDGLGGHSILRGNWDLTLSGAITAIPRGPESRYLAYIMGIRRNFVPRNSRIAPYFDVRLGVGNIDAQGPKGVAYAQGEDLTFTMGMGSGVRYSFGPRYSISAGLDFMHISNLDLSEGNGKPSWGVRNYGINVYGPMVGLDIQLRRHRRQAE